MTGHPLYRLLTPVVVALGLALSGCASTRTNETVDRLALASEAYQAGNYDRAFALTRAEAELGNPRAQYALGYMYFKGEGVGPDTELALRWIRQAAEKGDPKAVEALSRLAGSAMQPPPPEETTRPAPAAETTTR